MFKFSPSHWESHRTLGSFDVLIIGSGMVGLWTAYHYLRQFPGKKVLLVDQLPHGQAGASTRNAGFACFGSPTELLDDLKHESEAEIIQRLGWRYQGLQAWLAHFDARAIDWTPEHGYEVFSDQEKESYQAVLASLDHLNSLAHTAEIPGRVYQIASSIGPKLPYTIQILHEAGLHPGKAHQALSAKVHSLGAQWCQGLHVPPKTEWVRIGETWKIPSVHGEIEARQVVVAANAWASELLPHLDVLPGRGQVLLTSPIPGLPFRGTYHADAGYLYFRNIGDRLLLGGGRNAFRQAEQSHQARISNEVQDYLERYAREVLLPSSSFDIEERWAGIMAFSSNGSKMPYVHAESDQCYVAARMGGMGVALAPVLGQQMADLLE